MPFLLLTSSSFVIFDNDYALISCPLCKLNTIWNVFMILGRNVEQNETKVSRTRMSTLAFLLLELSPFVLFFKLISCSLCNSNTIRNILMVFGRNVEQDETTCRLQEWQLCLSYFWRYLPVLYLTIIMHWFCVRSVSRIPFKIFYGTW